MGARSDVSTAVDFGSSRFRDLETSPSSESRRSGVDLATVLELERWNANVGGRKDGILCVATGR